MKKIKNTILAITLLMLLSGCSINYNIKITADGVEETIKVNDKATNGRTKKDILNEYNSWFPAYYDGNTGGGLDITKKQEGLPYHEKSIQEISNGYSYTYKYKYTLNNYQNANSTKEAFEKNKFYVGSDYIIINTNKENLLCNYNYFENLNVTITIDPEVYRVNESNADKKNNNQYTWNLNRNNCNDSEIYLKLDVINQEKFNSNEPTDTPNEDEGNNIFNTSINFSKYSLYIFLAVLGIVIYFGYKWFIEFKDKNDSIN